MSQFIQMHLLTMYPPSNLNRDDLGRPKTAIVGGSERLRISSQSLKRAWRTSEQFQEALSDYQGTRTKRLGEEVFSRLTEKGVAEKQATEWAVKIAGVFGKSKNEKPLEIEQLAHISPEEWSAVNDLADKLVEDNRGPETEELGLLRQTPKAADIALFGRMLASSPAHNVEAAAQVSHAFTVNPVKIEDDFFTAVDDLNTHEEDAGAGHMGDAGFGSGVFYTYCCINKDLLISNLQNDEELANQALSALAQSAATVAPTGKQNSFASRAYTSYLLAEKGPQQPRSLSVAFLKAAKGEDPLAVAIENLEKQRANFEQAYGACADEFKVMNVPKGEGSLEEIIHFITE
ncbi:MAG: type I-E CRISPR-associated protein Cas7/Cse4/CasC [Gammaproteobacteria bacterium]|nr:type I-E CRISPR-associated protein Cas7/Cse4/CasC [Gammaproteobacteria bacterium]